MKISDAYPSKYLKPPDVRPSVYTIKNVTLEELGEVKDKKPVAYFREEAKGLVLNRTNANIVTGLTGSEDTDTWAGTQVGLIVITVQFQGRLVDSIRVTTPPRATHAASDPTDGVPF